MLLLAPHLDGVTLEACAGAAPAHVVKTRCAGHAKRGAACAAPRLFSLGGRTHICRDSDLIGQLSVSGSSEHRAIAAVTVEGSRRIAQRVPPRALLSNVIDPPHVAPPWEPLPGAGHIAPQHPICIRFADVQRPPCRFFGTEVAICMFRVWFRILRTSGDARQRTQATGDAYPERIAPTGAKDAIG